MTIGVFIAFLFLTAVDVLISVRFVRTNNKAYLAATVFAWLPFALYLLAVYLFDLAIPDYVLYIVVAAQFIRTFFGYYLDWYEKTGFFDRSIHAYGCFAYALLVFCTIRSVLGAVLPKLVAAFFVLTIGMTVGVLIEIVEFALDSRKKKIGIRLQKGLRDTDFDLIFDTIGSFAAGVFAYFTLL